MSSPTSPQPSFDERERRFLDALVARRQEQPGSLSLLQDALLELERRIGLIERCLPINFGAATADLELALARHDYHEPNFVYRPRGTDVDELLRLARDLETRLRQLVVPPSWELVARQLADRAAELYLDAQLVDARDKEARPDLVAKRYEIEPELGVNAAELAREWLGHRADDLDVAPVRLLYFLERKARQEGIELRVWERPLASIAAVSRDGLVIQPGATVSLRQAERIWVHEVHGHLLPRRLGEHCCAPLLVGTRGAGEDEEGRALYLEKDGAWMDSQRRQELAARHLVAIQVREGRARVGEVAVDLVRGGQDPRLVARALCRALRAGGLAREAVYLPAFLRVERAFIQEPQLHAWMRWGRVSVRAARQLENWLWSNSMTVGA